MNTEAAAAIYVAGWLAGAGDDEAKARPPYAYRTPSWVTWCCGFVQGRTSRVAHRMLFCAKRRI